ncbi:low molecular weight protein arginine phosphatase [candidate division KSB1 bacterium]|nr:low molecular weight protein arginine phosphatase [candidate division KSB1 bacterium]
MFQIVFVCSGNICRSPMAEALLKHLWPADCRENVHICSAGTLGIFSVPADSHAVTTLAEWGLDLSRHRSQGLRDSLVNTSDLFLVMEAEHREWMEQVFPDSAGKVHLLCEYARDGAIAEDDRDIPDPVGLDLDVFRKIRDRIRDEIERILPDLLARQGDAGSEKRSE